MTRKEYHRRWYKKNKKRRNAQNRAWQQKNIKRVKAQRLAYYKKNKKTSHAASVAWRKKNRNRSLEISRKCHKKRALKKLGHSLEAFDEALRFQSQKCAICALKFSKHRKAIIDHCHKRLKFRGLLCSPCNLALGLFRDSPLLLETAAKYLRGSK